MNIAFRLESRRERFSGYVKSFHFVTVSLRHYRVSVWPLALGLNHRQKLLVLRLRDMVGGIEDIELFDGELATSGELLAKFVSRHFRVPFFRD